MRSTRIPQFIQYSESELSHQGWPLNRYLKFHGLYEFAILIISHRYQNVATAICALYKYAEYKDIKVYVMRDQ